MYFVAICWDKPDAAEIRAANKLKHKAHLDAAAPGVKVLQSGPLLSPDLREVGSLLVFEAETAADIEAFMNRDPYALAGLVASRDIRPWLWRRGNPYLVTDAGS